MSTNKYFLVIATTTALLLTACSIDETGDNTSKTQEISFDLEKNDMPSSVLRTTSSLDAFIDAFIVYGMDDKPFPYIRFNGVTVARQANGPPFAFASKLSWYEYATMANIDYRVPSPFDIYLEKGGPTYPFDKDLLSRINNNQEDFLVIDTTIEHIASFGSIASYPPVVYPFSPLEFKFRHGLARILVSATNETNEPVIITLLSLQNLFSKGTLQFKSNEKWCWIDQDDRWFYPYPLPEAGVAIPAHTKSPRLVVPQDQGMMVMPQEIDYKYGAPEEIEENIDYSRTFNLCVEYDFANRKNVHKNLLIGNKYRFEAGKQYKIHIHFTASTVSNYEIEITDFEDSVVNINSTYALVLPMDVFF